jgi:hypothetical protein
MAMSHAAPEDVKRKMKFDYVKTKSDSVSRSLEGFQLLLSHLQRPRTQLKTLLQEAANFIQKQYSLRWVAIGVRSPTDRLFRFEVHSGLRPEAWSVFKQKAYRDEAFELTTDDYKAEAISKLAWVYLEEENPLDKTDLQSLNRPALIHSTRRSPEDSLEADYVDVHIRGPDDELLGWIECSGTFAGKLPDATTIRCIEVVSAILGAALYNHDKR